MDTAIAQQALLDGLRNLCDNTEATFDPDAFTAASVRGFALQLQDLQTPVRWSRDGPPDG